MNNKLSKLQIQMIEDWDGEKILSIRCKSSIVC